MGKLLQFKLPTTSEYDDTENATLIAAEMKKAFDVFELEQIRKELEYDEDVDKLESES